ncbi:MAG TPA: hypothetical protein VFB60_14095 [Ktedonobacteraceae bacterium]|nr:hypothetical protein [Ktedonobacteraceae bacterium]
MINPRLSAAIYVLLLIGVLSLIGISAAMWIGPAITHGTGVAHNDGQILSIGPNMDFVLLTTKGQVHFQCSGRCRGELKHMQRHRDEKAHTDVYYRQDANKNLIAIDVD